MSDSHEMWKRLETSVGAHPHAFVAITGRGDGFRTSVAIVGAGLVRIRTTSSSYVEFALEKMAGAEIEFLGRDETPIARADIQRLLPRAEPRRRSNYDYVAEVRNLVWYESEAQRLAKRAELQQSRGFAEPEV